MNRLVLRGVLYLSSLETLADEYAEQEHKINIRIDALKPLLSIYTGDDLLALRKKIKILEDMALECWETSIELKKYYDD